VSVVLNIFIKSEKIDDFLPVQKLFAYVLVRSL
jgi:hypothetical protein